MNIEAVLSDKTINKSIKHTQRRKHSPDANFLTAETLPDYWKAHGQQIKEEIRSGSYTPEPMVTRLIPKPGKTEKRKLTIPCVLDRMILYAIHTALSPYYESRFSRHSYGFRKNSNCQDALQTCLNYINQGYDFVIDLDIRNFFDNIDHSLLLQRLQEDISDSCLLNLIRKYLKTKVQCGRHIYQNFRGLPQGSAISPLLANVFLDSFDHRLERELIKFVRYADDIVIFCKTKEEAERYLPLAREYLNARRLELNDEKTCILRAGQLHYLGHAFQKEHSGKYMLTIDNETRNRMLVKMQEHLNRHCLTIEEWWQRLGSFHRGWINYYKDVPPHIMIPFLLLAEEKELLHFSLKVCSPKMDFSQKYISALFNCPYYSSLTGWYQRTIICNNDEMIRRMNEMRQQNRYYDKHSIWRSKDFFTEKESLKSRYQSLVEKPFYFDAQYELDLYHYSCDVNPGTEQDLDAKDLLILGILAAGKNMTLAQLTSYLLLKNTDVSLEELNDAVNRLIELGIVNRTTIHPSNPLYSSYNTTCYQVTEEGRWFIQQIYAPADFSLFSNGFMANFYSMRYFYTSTILWNQIVLNYILYCDNLVRFEITSPYYFPGYPRLIIPLYIETETNNYFFSYLKYVNEETLHKVFLNWDDFQKNSKKDITFVLVANDEEQLLLAKTFLFRESLFSKNFGISNLFPDIDNHENPRQGTICNKTVFLNKVAFSLVPSWFHDSAGTITPYRIFS